MSLAAVFDAGKTHLKLSLVTSEGNVVSSMSSVTSYLNADNEWPWQMLDVSASETFLVEALRQARKIGVIECVVPVGHAAAAAWIDQDGLTIPPIDYEEDPPAHISSAYDSVRPDFEETGSPSLPKLLNLGRQIYWASTVFPEILERSCLVTGPQYWAWRLCGAASTELSTMGAHSDLWSVRDSSWSTLVRFMGWETKFAPLSYAGDTLGHAIGLVARAAWLEKSVRILCGAHDSNAALQAVRLSNLGESAALVSTGTWFVVMAPGAGRALDPDRDCLVNVSVDGVNVPTARFMGGREHSSIARGGGRATPEACGTIVRNGTMIVPPVAKLGGPFMGQRSGTVGVPPNTVDEAAALAAIHLALMTNYCLDLVGATGPVVIEGPLAWNEAALGLLAALREVPILRSERDLVAIGGAALAFGRSVADSLSFERVVPWRIKGWCEYAIDWKIRAEAPDERDRQDFLGA